MEVSNKEVNNKFILELDSSQLEQYLICPLSWYYKYHESLRSSQLRRKAAPDKGTLIHKMAELFYKLRNNNIPRYAAARQVQDTLVSENWAKEFDLEKEVPFLKARFLDYVKHWDERDFSIIRDFHGEAAVEVGFSKKLYENENSIYIVTGRIDGITEISAGNAWIDHKTQAREMLIYPFNPQFLTYSWATGLEWGIINYIRMHQEYDPKKTFYKQIINFPSHLLAQWETKMLKIFQEIDEGINSTLGPLAYFYRLKNEASCAGPFKSFPCQFTTLCEVNIQDERLYNNIKSTQYIKATKWQPWKIANENNENGE